MADNTGFALKKDLWVFVKDVKLKEQNVSIETAKSVRFNVKVTSELADNPKVLWQSGNDAVGNNKLFVHEKGGKEKILPHSVLNPMVKNQFLM